MKANRRAQTTTDILDRAAHEHGLVGAPRIVVADDDANERRRLQTLLQTMGYDVVEAATGGELLDKIAGPIADPEHEPPVDGIISRARLPLLGGLEAVAALRESDNDIPVVLTSSAGELVWSEAQRLGVIAVLERPVLPRSLLAVLRACIPGPA